MALPATLVTDEARTIASTHDADKMPAFRLTQHQDYHLHAGMSVRVLPMSMWVNADLRQPVTLVFLPREK